MAPVAPAAKPLPHQIMQRRVVGLSDIQTLYPQAVKLFIVPYPSQQHGGDVAIGGLSDCPIIQLSDNPTIGLSAAGS